MRTTQLITSYVDAVFFLALGIRSILDWIRQRDQASGHLALATGLFGISFLMSAITTTIYNQAAGDVEPRALQITSTMIGLLAIFFFLVFLFDFIKAPQWVEAVFGVTTVAWMVLSVIERPDLQINDKFQLVPIPGVHNPIHYRSFIGALLVYYAVILGILWLAFLINGLRQQGLARFRMTMIATGFFLLFVAIGVLPRILFGNPSAETIKTVFTIVEYIAIASAPLLYLGFATPSFISNRFSRAPAAA